MFNKKECSNCGKKIKKNYEFCPFCGGTLNKKSKENLGMLGDNDNLGLENISQSIFSGFGGGMLNKMLGNAMKMLEKEMQREIQNQNFKPKTNVQLFINGKKINVSGMSQQKPQEQKEEEKFKSIHFSQKNQEKFISLPQEEPQTNIRRLSDKILYEIELPKVNSIESISIIKLENSVEIKAVAKDKAYFKSISINLDLINSEFEKERLILEFKSKN